MGINQKSYETLSRVVHDAQLEALLVLEGFGQSAAQSIRWENLLAAELELGEDALKPQKETAAQSKMEILMQPRLGTTAFVSLLLTVESIHT